MIVDKDLYELLGISQKSSSEEIKKAYRSLALKYHPDRNPAPEATERFKEITAAYGVLIDEKKRREYDIYRKIRQQGGRPTKDQEFRYSSEDIFRDLFRHPVYASIFQELQREFSRSGYAFNEDFFRKVFSGQGGQGIFFGGWIFSTNFPSRVKFGQSGPSPSGSADLFGMTEEEKENIPLILSPVLPGLKKICQELGGRIKGWLGYPQPSGSTALQKNDLDLFYELNITSEEGRQGIKRTLVFQGWTESKKLKVTIPAGIHNGTKLRLKGKGKTDSQARSGDIYLTILVRE